ncbi:hypothetical protein GCM10010279_16730 [Streptomyces mutabilis]|nr:hypothetical protein GCM10010279_16730 [Streptomyces mutabilis]
MIAQTTIGVLRDPDELLSADHEAQIIALVVVGTCLVVFCVVTEHRARELMLVNAFRVAAHRQVGLDELVAHLDRRP